MCVCVVRVCCACVLCVVRVYSSTCGRPDLTSVVLCYSDMNTSSYKCVRACLHVCIVCILYGTFDTQL